MARSAGHVLAATCIRTRGRYWCARVAGLGMFRCARRREAAAADGQPKPGDPAGPGGVGQAGGGVKLSSGRYGHHHGHPVALAASSRTRVGGCECVAWGERVAAGRRSRSRGAARRPVCALGRGTQPVREPAGLPALGQASVLHLPCQHRRHHLHVRRRRQVAPIGCPIRSGPGLGIRRLCPQRRPECRAPSAWRAVRGVHVVEPSPVQRRLRAGQAEGGARHLHGGGVQRRRAQPH
jgi:hypothetical protein